jgi:putative transposase
VDGTDGAQCDDGRFWFLINRKYLLHDRDSKYCSAFRQVIEAGRVKTLVLPPRSPNLNAYAERWVRSVKEECLAKLILLGEGSLRRALRHNAWMIENF